MELSKKVQEQNTFFRASKTEMALIISVTSGFRWKSCYLLLVCVIITL